MCVLLFMAFFFLCGTCVSEGTSLEEQVRRIKDIEAIESDSFVPQAFKSSRDVVKVRSVSLSLTNLHSVAFYSVSYWISPPFLQCCAVCPETAQTKSSTPIQHHLFRHPTPPSSSSTFATSEAAAPTQKLQRAFPRVPPLWRSTPSGCADADKMLGSLWKCFSL